MSIRAGIIGISGYTGVVLHRLLVAHPEVRLTVMAAGNAAGKRLDQVWPGLGGMPDAGALVTAVDPDALIAACDVVFLALPHGLSASLAPTLLDAGVAVIDLGADFRLKDPAVYQAAYGAAHPCPERLPSAVYGLPEQNRAALHRASLVACPGCYPTATALAALPLVEEGLVDWLIADCLSGVSGAGRSPGPKNLYCEVTESAVAYGLAGSHRHTPEIEQTLGARVTFTPHLVPMSRGMLATVHGRLLRPLSAADLRDLYASRYADHPMVALRDGPPATAEVRGSNRAHVHVTVNATTGVVTAVAAIDNLVKGASGQAVQCMNLAFGLPETTGLPLLPLLP